MWIGTSEMCVCKLELQETEAKLQEMLSEKDWWKAEATTCMTRTLFFYFIRLAICMCTIEMKVNKECKLNAKRLQEVKNELNSAENNKLQQSNVDVWRSRCYALYWRRFAEFVSFEESMAQMHEVLMCVKSKQQQQRRKAQPFEESFKISMFRSLKDVENLDMDKLLLCQDTKQLAQFLLSSDMSPQLQLKVAAQLLPVVESQRIKLQKDITVKIDRIIKKRKKRKVKATHDA